MNQLQQALREDAGNFFEPVLAPALDPVVDALYTLKDASGQVVALAEKTKRGVAVSHGDEGFVFRKPSFFSRPYHLYREGSDQSLGAVGQKKFFTTTLHMDLPAGFDRAFQVFLLALLLNLTMQALESSTT